MGNKRTAAEASRPSSPRSSAKRQRASNGLPRLTAPPRPPSPGRPPRMPRFEANTSDRSLVQQLNMLTGPELRALVKDVEMRYRKLAVFEAEEIRRAQSVTMHGFGRNSPLVVRRQATAW